MPQNPRTGQSLDSDPTPDSSRTFPTQDVHWATVVVDEAHRMKSSGSATRAVLEALPRHWLLLLTGEGGAHEEGVNGESGDMYV